MLHYDAGAAVPKPAHRLLVNKYNLTAFVTGADRAKAAEIRPECLPISTFVCLPQNNPNI